MIFLFVKCVNVSIVKSFILLSCVSFLTRGSSRRCVAVTASAFQSLPFASAISRPHRHDKVSSTTFTGSTCLSSNTKLDSTTSTMVESPPIPHREEDRVIYAGAAPDGWDPKIPRQANDSDEALLTPPIAIPDPYGWMRDDKRENKEVLDHLNAENAYSKSVIKHLEGLQDELYKELLSSIQETDYTAPRPRGDFWYYTRTFEGSSYRSYCRAPKTTEQYATIDWDGNKESPILPGEVAYLDVNELGKDKSYCSVGAVKPSPSQKLIAYSVDFKGDETYEMHVRNLETGEDIVLKAGGGDDKILETSGSLVWGKDDSTLYYMTMDEQHRPYRLYQRRDWQNDTPIDILLKEEPDDMFWAHVFKSLDEKYIFFETASKETSEIFFLPTESETTTSKMECIAARRNKVLYEVEHGHGNWWIWTNVDGSPNMKLMSCAAKPDCAADWQLVTDSKQQPIFDGSLAKALDSVTVLESHVVAQGREGGIPRIWVFKPETKSIQRLEFEEAAHDVGLGAQYEFNANTIAVAYDSLVTPPQTMEISLDCPDSERTILKSKDVPGYEKEKYGCDRLEVMSRDGKTNIPISVVYRKDVMEKVNSGEERVPIHLYGYGSYGSCCEADFDSSRLPLLERGMIYVIAHIRGGGEMGRQWYEEPNGAKFLCKKNTFNDFVDVARFLVSEWTTPDLLSCEGRSAGGMLIGAVINQAPELFRAAILGVPFVDVVGTMIDASIPLTAGEWVEWGNPNEEKYHQYMMEYSPMNNVKTGALYPSCWLTGGLHDPRVAFWEPSKFAATLRHESSNGKDRPICVKMDMSAGHFSASDRYKYYRELAIDYSFLLDQLGLVKK
ncbi:oligopeptidase B [Nitzschia inconspicua]|uniref:Prolyl endopeptidase-like n=1 Tax=Nitzschia inconspicua TaxID=303405 RepID=A0A9K3LRG0_9STRA|nr:oligopeptidase B [Nitzschia inconspicua]